MVDIKVKDISKSFNKKTVLNKICSSFPKGKLTSILGPSGCGKTTLLNCITGFLEPDAGSIYFDNQEVNKLAISKRKAPMVHQDLLLFPHMNVRDNISFGLRMAKEAPVEIKKKTDYLIERMGLEAEVLKYPSMLSGGQKQRVALGRALAIEPAVLLLDEAFSKLDTNLRNDMGKFVKGLQEELKITTILVTHDQEESMILSDKIIVMLEGEIAQEGTGKDLFSEPRTLSVAQFLGKENIIPVFKKEESYYFKEGVFPGASSGQGSGYLLLDNQDIKFSKEGISGEIIEISYCGSRGYKYKVKAFGENLFYNSHNPLPFGIGKIIHLTLDFSKAIFY